MNTNNIFPHKMKAKDCFRIQELDLSSHLKSFLNMSSSHRSFIYRVEKKIIIVNSFGTIVRFTSLSSFLSYDGQIKHVNTLMFFM